MAGQYPGFEARDVVTAPGVHIRVRSAGKAEPLLLLHGHPQTHAIWHKGRTGIGATTVHRSGRPARLHMGDSAKPVGEADHANYSKRVMARDIQP